MKGDWQKSRNKIHSAHTSEEMKVKEKIEKIISDLGSQKPICPNQVDYQRANEKK